MDTTSHGRYAENWKQEDIPMVIRRREENTNGTQNQQTKVTCKAEVLENMPSGEIMNMATRECLGESLRGKGCGTKELEAIVFNTGNALKAVVTPVPFQG